MSHRNFASFLAAAKVTKDFDMFETDVHLSYLPLPHLFDRLVSLVILANGASI